jgi:putative drug exporter of the RND superfamily
MLAGVVWEGPAAEVTDARAEAAQHGVRDGMIRAVSVTGGVITSAGILLAAVFCVLGVLPLIVLTQLGIIVGPGIPLDTFIVRTLGISALFALIGDRIPRCTPNTLSSKRIWLSLNGAHCA